MRVLRALLSVGGCGKRTPGQLLTPASPNLPGGDERIRTTTDHVPGRSWPRSNLRPAAHAAKFGNECLGRPLVRQASRPSAHQCILQSLASPFTSHFPQKLHPRLASKPCRILSSNRSLVGLRVMGARRRVFPLIYRPFPCAGPPNHTAIMASSPRQ